MFFVAAKAYPKNYKITVSVNVVKCNCKRFRFSEICSYSVAASEKEGILKTYLGKLTGVDHHQPIY